MPQFTLHSAETAPEAARPILDNVQRGFGFVPNLIRVMAQSPAPSRPVGDPERRSTTGHCDWIDAACWLALIPDPSSLGRGTARKGEYERMMTGLEVVTP